MILEEAARRPVEKAEAKRRAGGERGQRDRGERPAPERDRRLVDGRERAAGEDPEERGGGDSRRAGARPDAQPEQEARQRPGRVHVEKKRRPREPHEIDGGDEGGGDSDEDGRAGFPGRPDPPPGHFWKKRKRLTAEGPSEKKSPDRSGAATSSSRDAGELVGHGDRLAVQVRAAGRVHVHELVLGAAEKFAPHHLRVHAGDLGVQERVGRGHPKSRDRHADADELRHLPSEEQLLEVHADEPRVVGAEAEKVVARGQPDQGLLEPRGHSVHAVVHEGHHVALAGLERLAADGGVEVVFRHGAVSENCRTSRLGRAPRRWPGRGARPPRRL